MAVLNLLLANDVSARSMPELANVVAQHNAWTRPAEQVPAQCRIT